MAQHLKRTKPSTKTVVLIASVMGALLLGALFIIFPLVVPSVAPFNTPAFIYGLLNPPPEKGKALDDYTFAELSRISSLIQTSKNSVETAATYGICNEDGTIKDQVKRFKLKDDTVCEVRVIGIMQDTLAPHEKSAFDLSAFNSCSNPDAPTTKAGLTFMCAEVPATSVYEATPTAEGGWQNSTLRSYLNNELFNNLPDYLKDKIVSVEKMTNNVGFTDDPSAVSVTEDKIWEPSVKEINGDVNWDAAEYASGRRPNDTIMNAEGTQYQWFSQLVGADGSLPSEKLQMTFKGKSTSWWYRTMFPTTTMFGGAPYACCVMESGYPNGQLDATTSTGVAFGFCL